MNPLSGVLSEAWQMYKAFARHLLAIAFVIYLAASFGRSRRIARGNGWHVFGTLVLVYIIMLAVGIILGLIFSALPHSLANGLSSIISGTLIAPFLALVVTLVYYRLAGDAQAPPPPPAGFGEYRQTPP